MRSLLLALAFILLAMAASATKVNYTLDCMGGCTTGDDFFAINADQIQLAVDDNDARINSILELDACTVPPCDLSSGTKMGGVVLSVDDHTILSHDTDATGAELNELTDGSVTIKHLHDLGPGTTGNFMRALTQGTAIAISHTPSEGSNATIGVAVSSVGRTQIDESNLSAFTHANDCEVDTCTLAEDGEMCFDQGADEWWVCDGSGTPTWVFFPSGAHTSDTTCNGVTCALDDDTANLEDANDLSDQLASTAFVQQEINGSGGQDLSCSVGQCSVDATVARVLNETFTGILTLPFAAAPVTDEDGEIAIDLNAWAGQRDAIEVYDGTASTYLLGTLVSSVPGDGEVPKFNIATGTITWQADDGGGGGEVNTHSSDGGGLVLTAIVDKVDDDLRLVSLAAADFGSSTDLITINDGKWATDSELHTQAHNIDSADHDTSATGPNLDALVAGTATTLHLHNLGTGTDGDYMENVTGGTGITVTHTPSEGSTAALSFDATEVDDPTWGNATSSVWTFDVGGTNPSLTFASSSLTIGNVSVLNLPSEVIDSNEIDKSDGFVWTGVHNFGGATIQIQTGTSRPSCIEGQLFFDTDETAGQRLYGCEGTTFQLQGDGGGGGGGDEVLIDGTNVTDGLGVNLVGGTNGIQIAFNDAASPDIATIQLDTSEVDDVTWGNGTSNAWTFDVSGASDPSLTFDTDSLIFGNVATFTVPDDAISAAELDENATFAWTGVHDWTRAAPSFTFTDSDTVDGEPSFRIITNCTTTATASEDCDVNIQGRIGGVDTTLILLDANPGQILIGNSFVDQLIITTNSSGDTEVVLPLQSIGPGEIVNDSLGRNEIDESNLSAFTHADDCTLDTCTSGEDGEMCFDQGADEWWVCDGSGTPTWVFFASGAHASDTTCNGVTCALDDDTADLEAADNSTLQLATTSFVQQEINNADGTDLTCDAGVCNVDAAVARINNESFTGTFTVPDNAISAAELAEGDAFVWTGNHDWFTGAPAITFTDTDTTDGEVSLRLFGNCSTPGSGVEDCDVLLQGRIGGLDTTVINLDADPGDLYVGSANVDTFTVVTNGTGDTEVVLPLLSISGAEMVNSTITNTQMAGGGGFTWTGAHTWTAGHKIPTNFTNTLAGHVTVDTSANQFVYFSNASDRVLKAERTKCFTLETPDDPDDNIPLWIDHPAITVTRVRCIVEGGTNAIGFLSDGTDALDTMTCTTTASEDTTLSNATFAIGERFEWDTTSQLGDPSWLNVCWTYTIDRV